MSATSGDAHPFPIYNARFRLVFPILDADGDLVTGAASLDSELSQDQGTFADATNEATEIATSSGMYYLDLVAGELDTKSTAGIVKTATAGAKTTAFVLYPRRLPVIRTGTAQAGAATTITLDANASAVDDFYNGCYVNITNNSPANAQGQARRVTDYVGSTKVATVEVAWGTNPSSASTFEILAPGDTVNVTQWAGTQVLSPNTAGEVVARTNSSATGAITSATFAAGAINAAAIAADAITDAKVASDVTIASVTGAVGSVTGNVGGNVTGSVGSIASGGITAASFAANAITAAKLDPDVTTELQAGLATASALSTVEGKIDTIDANVDAVLEDTGTTLPATLATIAGYIDAEVASILSNVLALVAAGYTQTGTAQAGAAGTITLASGASSSDDFYNNQIVVIASGTGAGQARFISDYTGSSRVASVATWVTNPDNTSVYYVLPFGAIPGATAPTAAEVRQEIDNNSTQLAAIKAKTDNLPSDPADQSLVIAATTAIFDRIGAPTGASVSADIADVESKVDDLESRIGTPSNLGSGATVAANLADIEAQTDDIGAAGAGLTALGDTRLANLDATVSSRATPAQVNAEVVDALNVDTYPEPTGAPPATASLQRKISQQYKHLRNEVTQTSTTQTLKNDGGTTDITATVSDDGSTFTRSEWS